MINTVVRQTTNVHVENQDSAKYVEVLSDLQEKARQSIIDSVVVRGNTVNLYAQVCRDVAQYSYIFSWKFKLNGKVYKGEEKVEECLSREEMIMSTLEKVSSQIAVELISGVSNEGFLR